MVRKLPQTPDISEDYELYSGENEAYKFNEQGEIEDDFARQEVKSLFDISGIDPFDYEKQHRVIVQRLEVFRIAIREKALQMIDNPSWDFMASMDKKRHPDAFKKSPRTFLKTVQEILCEETERIPFTRDKGLEKEIRNIIIDVRRITDTLLRNLGLSSFVPRKRTGAKEKILARKEAIPEIRKMLTHLEPVRLPGMHGKPIGDLNYFRMMRIGDGANTGEIVGTQNINGKKVLFRTDLFGAERRILHIDASYKEEIRKLVWIERKILDLRSNLDYWKSPERRKEAEDLLSEMTAIVDSLEHVDNNFKKNLSRDLTRCLSFKDSLQRDNPSSKQAILTKALPEIGKRLHEIMSISTYIKDDALKVEMMIKREEFPIQEFLDLVEKYRDELKILDTIRFLTGAEIAKILANLDKLRRRAAEFKFEPNLSFGSKFIDQINKVETALMAGGTENRKLAAKQFLKLYLLAKMKRAHAEIEDIYTSLSVEAEKINKEHLHEKIKASKAIFGARLVSPGMQIPEYAAVFDEIYHLYNSLNKTMVEMIGSDTGKFGLMKKRIADFSFKNLIVDL